MISRADPRMILTNVRMPISFMAIRFVRLMSRRGAPAMPIVELHGVDTSA
jgi:hypothetical protein